MSNLAANKEVAKKFITAMGASDVETAKSLITDDMTIITTGTSVMSLTHDHDAVLDLIAGIANVTQSGLAFHYLNLTAEDDRVSVEMQGASTLLDGTPYNNQYHFLVFFRDGKIRLMREYLDTKLIDTVVAPRLPKQ